MVFTAGDIPRAIRGGISSIVPGAMVRAAADGVVREITADTEIPGPPG